jgi:hypothetical protein
MNTENDPDSKQRVIVAVFKVQAAAEVAIKRLFEKGCPMDMVSLLGKAESSGDDLLGIYYSGVGERMKSWAKHGAFWGGLWGLLASGAGMFIVPGLGAIFAVGPVVEAIAGAVAGATLTGGAMAGAAALSQLAVALHRMGVPEERLQYFHQTIEEGHYVLLLRCGESEEVERWSTALRWGGADSVEDYPFRRF